MNWETMYSNLLNAALPGVSFPVAYNFIKEHKKDITRVRKQSQLDATIERDQLRAIVAQGKGEVAARQRAINAGANPNDLDIIKG